MTQVKMPPVMDVPQDLVRTRSVHSLVCHAHVEMALTCLRSLVDCSVEPVQLVLHDDGTLTDEDCARLTEGLDVRQIIRRHAADDVVDHALRSYPALINWRHNTPMGVKVLDPFFFLDSEDLCFSDSDILYLQHFRNLYAWTSGDVAAILMDDYQNAYCLRPWQLLNPRFRLRHRCCAGLLMLRRSAHDFDYLDWFVRKIMPENLSREAWKIHAKRGGRAWLGQTSTLSMALRAGRVNKWSVSHVCCASPEGQYGPETVAVHFPAQVRNLLSNFLRQPPVARDAQRVISLSTATAEPFGLWGSTFELFRRRWKRK